MLFAQRFLAGTTSTQILQYWYYLGGLDRIRGFHDNRFAGRYHWLSNSEIRVPVFRRPSYIIQSVGFLDLTSVGENFKDLDSLTASSLGAGIRLILPKLYRFVIRMDYAKPIKKDDDMNISFGVQQFF
jgi:outer membrane protein assembly factor BamA